MENEIMTIKQLAEYLQISQRSIHRMIKRGGVPAVKVTNRWRFERSKINEWLTRNSEKACVASEGGNDV
ncbi:MAG TPA: helix-turn-helix domain-containing protein [Candidatus Brocadiia bacterium]|nr:helix-turn-helix domain-containing protein [Planctomycetota bacterium]MDO8094315.1 helix-turn-helix domain-containing protein [Candidatus Brocadiales bacterium]